MAHVFYLVPSGSGVGLTSVALGLVHALDQWGTRVAFFKPIGQTQGRDDGPERSTHFIAKTAKLQPAAPIPFVEAERYISAGRGDELLARVVGDFQSSTGNADVAIVEGLVDTAESPIEDELNLKLVQTLNAEVIIVGALRDSALADFDARARITAEPYKGRVIGCIVNRVPNLTGAAPSQLRNELAAALELVTRNNIHLIGAIPENAALGAQRVIDVARALNARVLHAGEFENRRVLRFSLLARSVPKLIEGGFMPETLYITPNDRSDAVLAVAMAAVKNIPIAGLVVTGEGDLPDPVLELCSPALASGMPLLGVPGTSWSTASAVMSIGSEIPADDLERVQMAMTHVAEHLDTQWLLARCSAPVQARTSPAAFCHHLVSVASQTHARIVLPEGTEPRTIKAAIQCATRKIARCILLGDPQEVQRVAAGLETTLPEDLEIIDPAAIRANYVAPLVRMRKHKGVTEREAAEMLEDNVWLGTVMLALGEVDGLVSGAAHSTANTIRPALQIIKTKPGARVVSSVFFMCLPDQVLVYGDCAVNPDPDAETLADIAIQSADSAASFGIEPRVAMISYSTGTSGAGEDVEKVREATRLARQRRPELVLDGPLQYDAAADAEVAKVKAPGSPVAGHATVFVFPDLNTGNTTYKAVQRSANVVSIGPMLQGMKKPVNDLSRGALIEDIVYTIAITAIQSAQKSG